MSQLNNRFIQARLALGMSQNELARRMGVSSKTVRRWEKGLAQPHPYCRPLLCAALHKTAAELGFEPEENVPFSPTAPQEQLPAFLGLLPLCSRSTPIGRDHDLAMLRQWVLRGESVAITGIPGVGKTALASTLAHDTEVRAHFQGCILWAALGQNPNLLDIVHTWSEFLGVSPHHATIQQGKAALQAAIGVRAVCVILDDVWDSADAVQLQLERLPCSSVYTSRFPCVTAELCGATCTSYTLRELTSAESFQVLRLLAPRAVEMEPERTGDLAGAVGGLPLALNLIGRALNRHSATGQARRVQAAFERLSNAKERLHLPVEAVPADPLQQGSLAAASLASVIKTSEDFLSEPARSAWRALSLLPAKPASFTEQAALATTDCSVDTVDVLCDLGFIECCGPDGYQMHQVIADYGRAHLEAPQRETAFLRVTTYVLQVLEIADDPLRLEKEIPTILIALEAATTYDLKKEYIQMIERVTPTLMMRGQLVLVEGYLQRACYLAREAQDDVPLPRLLWSLGNVVQMLARPEEATALYEEGLRLARVLHDEESQCALLAELGWLMHLYGFLDRAQAYLEEGIALASLHSLAEPLIILWKTQGALAWTRGNYPQAEAACQQGLQLLEHLDGQMKRELGTYYCMLAWLAGVQGQYEQAEVLFQQSIEAAEYYLPDCVAFVWGLRCTIQAMHHPSEALYGDLKRAQQRVQEFSVPGYNMYVHRALALVALTIGNVEEAEQEARRGFALAEHLQTIPQQGNLLTVLAEAVLTRGEIDQAAHLLEQALPLVRTAGAVEEIATTLVGWGEVQLRRQQYIQAEATFQEALQTAPDKNYALHAFAHYGLARAAAGRGEVSEALHKGKCALQVFASLQHRKTSEVRTWLHALSALAPNSLQDGLDQQNM